MLQSSSISLNTAVTIFRVNEPGQSYIAADDQLFCLGRESGKETHFILSLWLPYLIRGQACHHKSWSFVICSHFDGNSLVSLEQSTSLQLVKRPAEARLVSSHNKAHDQVVIWCGRHLQFWSYWVSSLTRMGV
jgi:hypothetical protein